MGWSLLLFLPFSEQEATKVRRLLFSFFLPSFLHLITDPVPLFALDPFHLLSREFQLF